MRGNKKFYKAQILLITLVILTILSIITISIIVINNRDLSEVQVNQKYDQIYSGVEDEIQNYIRTFGQGQSTLSELASAPHNCFQLTSSSYECDLAFVSENINFTGEVQISDEKSYDNFQVFKDRGLEVNFNGYSDYLDLYWEIPGAPLSDQASLEFILVYRDVNGNLRAKIDIYNPAGVVTSAPASANPFVYLENPLYPGNPFGRRVNFTGNLVSGEISEKLVIIPRMNNDNSSIELDLLPANSAAFPDQVRVFKGQGYDPNDFESPVVNLIAQLPIYPQTLGVFDYALLVDNSISMN